jgi:putative superfamily III holin-X
MAERYKEESVGELVRGALDDVRDLFREELALAKAELRQEIGKLSTAAMQFGVGGVALWFSAMFFLVAIALGVSALFNWPAWAAFGAVAILLAAFGTVLVIGGRSTVRDVRPLPRTVETVKENFR